MKDLRSSWAMWLKAGLFLLVGLMSAALLLLEAWSGRNVFLLCLCIWGFCRAYYFAFYVIERWVDPQFKFSGLRHFLKWAWARRKT